MWYDIWDLVLDELWYFVLNAPFILWIFIDAKKRMNHVLGWPLAMLLLGPIVLLPIWLREILKKERFDLVELAGIYSDTSRPFGLLQ